MWLGLYSVYRTQNRSIFGEINPLTTCNTLLPSIIVFYCQNCCVTIIQYIVYSMLYTEYIGPSFCVLRCDIALAGSGYITSLDTKLRSYILYIGPISILYNIHIYIYTCISYNEIHSLYIFNGVCRFIFCIYM